MTKAENNYAFVDSQNLNLSVREQGWILDFKKFRRYLQDKYGIAKAFIFIGYVPQNQDLYTNLQKDGYILIFKPTLNLPNGGVKGNVDAELVLHAMIESENYDKAQTLKEIVEDMNPLADTASVWTDLLNGALSEVNWMEIIEAAQED